jgi:hypothetical protein
LSKRNSDFKNCNATIYNEDDQTICTFPVYDVIGNSLELPHTVLNISDSKKYFDLTTGGTHYFYNLDAPALTEAMKLKQLRSDMAIKNIFSFNTKSSFDLFKFLPYMIIMLLIFFK